MLSTVCHLCFAKVNIKIKVRLTFLRRWGRITLSQDLFRGGVIREESLTPQRKRFYYFNTPFMAQRRMFSNRIANSAKFLQMPAESQLLYFHMILRADDDGIVEAYPITKLLGVAPDSFKVLLLRGYIKQLNEDQVVVITDWLEHNTIRADRKVDSIYKFLLPMEVKTITPKARSDVVDNSKRLGGQSTDGISKVRLGKVNNAETKVSDSLEKKENKTMRTYTDEDVYEEKAIDFDSGEILSPTLTKEKKTRAKNKSAIKLVHFFGEKAYQNLKVRPIQNMAAYQAALRGINNLTDEEIPRIIQEWFASGEDAENLIQITRCFSAVNINKFKANHGG